MRTGTSAHVGRLGACVLAAGAILAIVFQPAKTEGQAAAPVASAAAVGQGPIPNFVKLGFKFDGAQSCSNAQCHGADAPKEGAGATTLAEFTQWSGGDLHAKGYEQLTGEEGQKIATALKIADATTSARCTNCHTVDVPEKLHGKDYSKEEGVSCSACHGPSEKWIGPHKEKGWTDKQRAAVKNDHNTLLKKTGLFDTKVPAARAEMCTSCHLAIEADMVAAGHPEPRFELDFYGRAEEKGGYYVSQHWREPNTPFYHTTIWATGQAVAVRDAMNQLATRASAKAPNAKGITDAYNKAMAHYNVFKPVAASGVVKADAKAWDAQAAKIAAGLKAKKYADVAAGAKAVAAEAGKLIPALGAAKFDRAKTVAMAQALAKDAVTYKTLGDAGIEQQGYGILALYSSANPSKAEGDAPGKTRQLILDSLLFPPDDSAMDATKFAAGLKAITPQIK